MSKDRVIAKINDKGEFVVTNKSRENIYYTPPKGMKVIMDLSKAQILNHEFSHVEKIDGTDCYIYYKVKK